MPIPNDRQTTFLAGYGSGPAAIVDPRTYLQERVVVFTRTLFWLIVISSVLMTFVFLFAPPTPDFYTLPSTWATFLAPPIALGAMWRLAARGEPSASALRMIEVLGTFIPCVLLLTAPFGAPAAESDPVGGITGVIHLVVTASCFLVIRAAVVPCTPVTTLAVTTACLAPSLPLAFFRWNAPFAIPGLGIAGTGVFTVSIIALFVTTTATVVTRVVHRLEATARKAMQLGQYTLEESIGEGGMGTVYRARHALLRRPTAIKLLAAERGGDAAVARFEREVQHTSMLAHPNTVAIYDYGRTPDGAFYYAMEYLDGLDLDELVARDGPQPPARVIHILAQAADALAEAHDKGLVHRDVKPANIMLCHRGGVPDVVKVLDFGLVKDVAAPKEVSLTATSTITGTPLYLAPEALVDPDSVGSSTDLYALGAVAYWLLTGAHVFTGKTLVEVCSHHVHTAPTPPSRRIDRPIDDDLERLVLSCLEKKPSDRPTSAAALRSLLLACRAAAGWTRADADAWWSAHEAKLSAA